MGWLAAWLAFGLLAAYEAGEVALHAGDEWAPIRAMGYLLCSASSLAVIVVGAVRRGQPAAMRVLLAISLIALALCLWLLYGGGQSTAWVTAAMAGAAYALACLIIGGTTALLAWRRRVAREEEMVVTRVERERQGRLERIRAESTALAASADEADIDAESDFVLPTRPKWDDSA